MSTSSSSLEAALGALRRDLAADDTADLPDALVQGLVAAAAKLYFTRFDGVDDPISPLSSARELSATEVLALVEGLLREADLNQFDLRLWLGRRTNAHEAGANS